MGLPVLELVPSGDPVAFDVGRGHWKLAVNSPRGFKHPPFGGKLDGMSLLVGPCPSTLGSRTPRSSKVSHWQAANSSGSVIFGQKMSPRWFLSLPCPLAGDAFDRKRIFRMPSGRCYVSEHRNP